MVSKQNTCVICCKPSKVHMNTFHASNLTRLQYNQQIHNDSTMLDDLFIDWCCGEMPRSPTWCESDEGDLTKSAAWRQKLDPRLHRRIESHTKALSNTVRTPFHFI